MVNTYIYKKKKKLEINFNKAYTADAGCKLTEIEVSLSLLSKEQQMA